MEVGWYLSSVNLNIYVRYGSQTTTKLSNNLIINTCLTTLHLK